MKNQMEEIRVAFDDGALVGLFAGREINFDLVVKALNDILYDKKVSKIVVLDEIYGELEKSRNSSEICSNILSELQSMDILDYIAPPNGEEGIVDYCINNDILFISSDIRSNLQYKAKCREENFIRINLEQLSKLMELHKIFEGLDNKSLPILLKEMFDYKVMDTIDYISLGNEERFAVLLDFIVDRTLLKEEPEFIKRVKERIRDKSLLIIDTRLLKKSLKEISGYNFGHIDIPQIPLEERYSEVIEKFLEEKGFEDFKALEKSQPFYARRELVEGILRYYEIEVEGEDED